MKELHPADAFVGADGPSGPELLRPNSADPVVASTYRHLSDSITYQHLQWQAGRSGQSKRIMFPACPLLNSANADRAAQKAEQ